VILSSLFITDIPVFNYSLSDSLYLRGIDCTGRSHFVSFTFFKKDKDMQILFLRSIDIHSSIFIKKNSHSFYQLLFFDNN